MSMGRRGLNTPAICVLLASMAWRAEAATGGSPPVAPTSANESACIAPNQFAELGEATAGSQTDAYGQTSVALGAYERVSPDGRYILRSFSGSRLGQVSLIELSEAGQVLRAIPTPLHNEAFPVQGSWRYLVDTNGDHYTFKSMVQAAGTGPQVKPVFRGGMDGFYAAAAELPSDTPQHIRIRSLSWPHANGEGHTMGQGALMSQTIEVNVHTQRIASASAAVFHCKNRVAQDGPLYALPMISVDGQEFSALPQLPVQGKQAMRIFGFGADGTGCELRDAFDFSSGKAVFGFVQDERRAPLAWEHRGQAYWYSRELKTPLQLTPYELEGRRTGPDFEVTASAFPGITRDGRVIYAATIKDCAAPAPSGQPSGAGRRCAERVGYIISDPYQSNAYQQFMLAQPKAERRSCITRADVRRVRQEAERVWR